MRIFKKHKDKRGYILFCKHENCKFNILYTKKGMFRGGDYHSNTQYNVVLSGLMKIYLKDISNYYLVEENEFSKILPSIPHLFEAIKDTIMLEWWDSEFNAKFFKPFRDMVETKDRKIKDTFKENRLNIFCLFK